MEALIECIPFLLVFMGLSTLRTTKWDTEQEKLQYYIKSDDKS